MIAAVTMPVSQLAGTRPAAKKREQRRGDAQDMLATEWLALSYEQQSQHDLNAALRSARQAVKRSPTFGFGWARVAELEFSHGNIVAARKAADQALRLSPRNAQAHAVRAFLLAGENRIAAATDAFEEAIRLDRLLANGWLGRGLCRIRRGDLEAGREDLRVAATLEPRRSLIRSYVGKAFADSARPKSHRRS